MSFSALLFRPNTSWEGNMVKGNRFDTSVQEAMATYGLYLREVWGGYEYSELIRAVSRLCIPWKEVCIDVMNREVSQRPYIVFGERSESLEQSSATQCMMNALLLKRGDLRIFFSGGVKNREYLGQYCATSLARDFEQSCDPHDWIRWRDLVEVDNMSMNTGDQVSRLVHDAQLHGVRIFFLCISIEHIARFAAVLAHALKRAGIHDASIVPLAYGQWGNVLSSGLTSAEEAFEGPGDLHPQEGDDDRQKALAIRAGQYAERWKLSYEMVRDGEWQFGAMLPSELNTFLNKQPWQF